jgi:hypothetical protein
MEYNASLQDIAWINARRVDGSLEISPKFQRRAVWMEAERQSLISTIMEALPFPEIYIQQQTDPTTGAQKHIVVDGQQRVTSILKFIDNEVSLPIADAWTGEYFADLNDPQKSHFWDYKVVVRILRNTSDAEIRDLFARLNTNNISLNDQELRNARFKGRFKNACEGIADNSVFQVFGLFTAREIRRMVDVEFASELLVLTIHGITNKKDLIDPNYAEFEEEFPGEVEYVSEVETTLALVRSVLSDNNKVAMRARSNFYSVFGACLRYTRVYHRPTFHNPNAVSACLSDLLNASRSADTAQTNASTSDYFEAVSRAASDRGRRGRREDILFNWISRSDAGIGPNDDVVVSLEMMAANNVL